MEDTYKFQVSAKSQNDQLSQSAVEATITIIPSPIGIISPREDECLSGVVSIEGNALGGPSGLYSWVLEVKYDDGPLIVLASGTKEVTAGKLTYWDTVYESQKREGDGWYTLRLTVTENGGSTSYDEVTVFVDNTPPAITPLLESLRNTLGDYNSSYTTSNTTLKLSGVVTDSSLDVSTPVVVGAKLLREADVTFKNIPPSDINIDQDGNITGTVILISVLVVLVLGIAVASIRISRR